MQHQCRTKNQLRCKFSIRFLNACDHPHLLGLGTRFDKVDHINFVQALRTLSASNHALSDPDM